MSLWRSPLQSGAIRCPAATGISRVGSKHDRCAAAHRVLICPTLAVVPILIQRDYVDDEMPPRGRARIAGSAVAARIDRIADCPASAGVPGHSGSEFPRAGLCGDRYLEK